MFTAGVRAGLVLPAFLLLSVLVLVAALAPGDADAKKIHKKKHPKFAYVAESYAYDLEGTSDMTAFGDSLTSGAVDPAGGFVVRLSNALEAQQGPLTWHKFVRGGAPSAFWALALPSGAFDDYLRRSEVVSVETGAADMIAAHVRYSRGLCGGPDGEECYRQAVGGAKSNWDAILAHLKEVAPQAPPYCGVYFDFAADYDPPEAHETYERYLTELEAAVRDKCEAAGGTFLDFHHALNGPDGDWGPFSMGYMADAIHPNAEGHRLMAESAVQ